MTDRREFLKRLARGAAYAAPVMATFAAPDPALGQGQSSQHKQGGGNPMPAAYQPEGPWDNPPPGQRPPPSP